MLNSFLTLLLLLCVRVVRMEKIMDSFGTEDMLFNLHHCVHSRGHLLLFGAKGVQQPTYSSYRNTVLLGSYAIDVDLATKQLNRSAFPSIDEAEDRQEIIFHLGGQIYMLTYGTHEVCDFVGLYAWNDAVWRPIPLKVESKAKFGNNAPSTRCKLQYTVVGNDSVLFAFSKELSRLVIFSQLVVAGDAGVIVHLFTVDSLPAQFSSIVFSGLRNGQLIGVPGSYGCGFRWHPDSVVRADPKEATVEVMHLESASKPHWAFGGPLSTFQWKNKMLLVGGGTALGISKVKFNGEIWTFDLDTFAYEILSHRIPEAITEFNVCLAFDAENGTLYIADVKHGIYRLQLEN